PRRQAELDLRSRPHRKPPLPAHWAPHSLHQTHARNLARPTTRLKTAHGARHSPGVPPLPGEGGVPGERCPAVLPTCRIATPRQDDASEIGVGRSFSSGVATLRRGRPALTS